MEEHAKKDFEELISYLESIKIFPPSEIVPQLKKIHKVVYSIALWDLKLYKHKYTDNKRIFVSEARSNLIQSIPLALLGYNKSAGTALRSSLECMLYHVYFFDHPIEYHKGLSDKDYIQIKDLFEYLKTHPVFKENLQKTELFSQFKQKYHGLSELVHGIVLNKNSSVLCLQNITFDQSFFKSYSQNIYFIGSVSNFLLGIFHQDIFSKLDKPTQRFLLNNMDSSLKPIFHE